MFPENCLQPLYVPMLPARAGLAVSARHAKLATHMIRFMRYRGPAEVPRLGELLLFPELVPVERPAEEPEVVPELRPAEELPPPP